MPTHRRCRRDSTVEWNRVSGVDVNAPVGSRDPVYNFLYCWAIEVGDKWRHNDIMVEKIINIDQNSCCQTAIESLASFQIVDRIRRQSSWASGQFCAHPRRRRDLTRQLRRVGVGGVYWALIFYAFVLCCRNVVAIECTLFASTVAPWDGKMSIDFRVKYILINADGAMVGVVLFAAYVNLRLNTSLQRSKVGGRQCAAGHSSRELGELCGWACNDDSAINIVLPIIITTIIIIIIIIILNPR